MKILLLFFLIFVSREVSAEPLVHLSKSKIKKGEPLQLELDFEGRPSLEVPQRVVTQNQVSVEYLGSQDNFSMVNGKVFQKRTLKFRVVTPKDGRLQTPAFTVIENGNSILIPPQTFEVTKEKYSNHAQNLDEFDSLFDRVFGFQKRLGSYLPNLDDIHIVFRVNKNRVYIGETLVGYYLFFLRDMTGWFLERNQQVNPEFPFFTVELLSNVSIEAPLTDEYNGVVYNLFPYQREVYALSPLRKGKYKIGKTNFLIIDGALESLFSQKSIEAEPSEVTVLELPQPSPSNFSGEVGNYKVQVKVSSEQIYFGEPVQVNLEISGIGTGVLFNDPLTHHCKMYTCKARISFLGEKRDRNFTKVGEGRYAFKTNIQFQYSIFPLQEGTLDLGNLSINFFNPEVEEYQESTIQIPKIEVLPKVEISEEQIESEKNFYLPVLSFLLLGSLIFLLYNFKEDLLFYIQKIIHLQLHFLDAQTLEKLQELDKLIGSKTGSLLKNYLYSKGFSSAFINKILQIKSEHSNKKLVDIYKTLKKEDKEELISLIQRQSTGGEKI